LHNGLLKADLDNKQLAEFEVSKEIVAMVRNVRAQKQLSPKEKLEVIEKSDAQHSSSLMKYHY
jgi:valyl-tRNA synthetase